MNRQVQPLTPAALYARVSSDRQDVDSPSPPIYGTRTIMERLFLALENWSRVCVSVRMFILKEYRHAKGHDSL